MKRDITHNSSWKWHNYCWCTCVFTFKKLHLMQHNQEALWDMHKVSSHARHSEVLMYLFMLSNCTHIHIIIYNCDGFNTSLYNDLVDIIILITWAYLGLTTYSLPHNSQHSFETSIIHCTLNNFIYFSKKRNMVWITIFFPKCRNCKNLEDLFWWMASVLKS